MSSGNDMGIIEPLVAVNEHVPKGSIVAVNAPSSSYL